MPLETWIAFAVTAASVIAMPGPTTLLIAGYALSAGAGTALASVAGVVLGDITAITLAFAGMGAALAASAGVFLALKWAGALYLFWLGLQLWRRQPEALGPAAAVPALPLRGMIGKAYLVTVLNPKGLLFFTAIMPQFLSAGRPVLPQMAILGATHVILAILILALYVRLSGRLRQKALLPAAMRAGNRLSGSLLIGAGMLTALTSRP